MKTIRVIDLLNKIANGEEIPKEIGYSRKCYYLTNNHDIDEFGGAIGMFALNDEIEILDEDYIEDTPKEDKKIEKIEERIDTGLVGTKILDEFEVAGAINKQASYTFDIAKKINEIIDKINGEDNE